METNSADSANFAELVDSIAKLLDEQPVRDAVIACLFVAVLAQKADVADDKLLRCVAAGARAIHAELDNDAPNILH